MENETRLLISIGCDRSIDAESYFSRRMNESFWKGRRVFLTGHTGFKGGWLSLWLQQLGAIVTGYSLAPSTEPSLFEVAQVASGMTSIIGDIRDLENLKQCVAEAKPEIIFHLAAQPLVRQSYENPVETYLTNVMGTVHLLEAVRASSGVRAVVNVTSDKCYDNKEQVWGYRESDAMGGHDPYSGSKGCAELVTASYRKSFFENGSTVGLASARAGNVIGGGDWSADRLIPDMLRAVTANRPVSIRNPHSVRPWQHVLEPLAGYLLLAEKLYEDRIQHANGWNFGPNDAQGRPVEWIINQMTKAWGDGATWKLDSGLHPHEAFTLKLDSSKAASILGWHPRWTIYQCLEKIVEWHKAYNRGSDMRALTLKQISDYRDSTLQI